MLTRATGLCLMGWILTASGAIAGSPERMGAFAPHCGQSAQQRLEVPEIVDLTTGAALRLISQGDGAVQTSLTWSDLDVRKVTQPNGDFTVRLAGRHDLLVLVRAGDRLRVSRNGQSAVFMLTQADEDGLDQVQQVIAGSRATRMFRSLRGRLAAESLGSAPGVSIDLIDVLLGILQGDRSVLERRDPRVPARLSRAAFRGGVTCYSEYEAEAIAAWDDLSQCIQDVRWFPGFQELCACSWLLRTESAWFRFIACSAFPLKVA